jgi:hypothetical protein
MVSAIVVLSTTVTLTMVFAPKVNSVYSTIRENGVASGIFTSGLV